MYGASGWGGRVGEDGIGRRQWRTSRPVRTARCGDPGERRRPRQRRRAAALRHTSGNGSPPRRCRRTQRFVAPQPPPGKIKLQQAPQHRSQLRGREGEGIAPEGEEAVAREGGSRTGSRGPAAPDGAVKRRACGRGPTWRLVGRPGQHPPSPHAPPPRPARPAPPPRHHESRREDGRAPRHGGGPALQPVLPAPSRGAGTPPHPPPPASGNSPPTRW